MLVWTCGCLLGHRVSPGGPAAPPGPGRALSAGGCAPQAWAALPREHRCQEEMWKWRFHLQVSCPKSLACFAFFPPKLPCSVEWSPLAQLGKYLLSSKILPKSVFCDMVKAICPWRRKKPACGNGERLFDMFSQPMLKNVCLLQDANVLSSCIFFNQVE